MTEFSNAFLSELHFHSARALTPIRKDMRRIDSCYYEVRRQQPLLATDISIPEKYSLLADKMHIIHS